MLAFLLFFIPLNIYSQVNIVTEKGHVGKQIFDSIALLNEQLSLFKSKLIFVDSTSQYNYYLLKNRIDSVNRIINDGRVRESLNAAEVTINKLDVLIDSFAVIYAVISIVIILLTVGLPIIIQQLSIKPMKDEIKTDHAFLTSELDKLKELKLKIKEDKLDQDQKTENLLKKFETDKTEMFQQIKLEFDNKFQDYLTKNKIDIIDQALINLTSEKNDFQSKAINYISLTPTGDFTDNQLLKISKILRDQKLDLDKSEVLSRKLSEIESIYSEDFFSKLPLLDKINSKNTRLDGYNYFAKVGVLKYKREFSDLLLSQEPTQDYLHLIDWFRSSHQAEIIAIINFEELNSNKAIDIKAVYEKLQSWCYYHKYKDEIEKSHLAQKYKELNVIRPD